MSTTTTTTFAGATFRRDGQPYRPPACSICKDKGFIVITKRHADADIERDYLYACTCYRGEKWRKITATITGG